MKTKHKYQIGVDPSQFMTFALETICSRLRPSKMSGLGKDCNLVSGEVQGYG